LPATILEISRQVTNRHPSTTYRNDIFLVSFCIMTAPRPLFYNNKCIQYTLLGFLHY
jgi:hypothetical protein